MLKQPFVISSEAETSLIIMSLAVRNPRISTALGMTEKAIVPH